MFLYLISEITYGIKFGIVLELVMSIKTSAKYVWNDEKICKKMKPQK